MKKLICMLIALLFVFCAATAEKAPENWYELSEDGSHLTVRLDGNYTTGYQWTAAITNENVLEPVSEEYVPDARDEKIAGAGGVYTAVFKACVPDDADFVGEVTSVVLDYARSFEENSCVTRAILDLFVDEHGSISVGNSLCGEPDAETKIEYELNDERTILTFRINGMAYEDCYWDFSIDDETILQDITTQTLPEIGGLTAGFAGSFFAANTPFADEQPIVPGTTQITFTFAHPSEEEGEVPLFNCVYNVTVAEDGTLSVE